MKVKYFNSRIFYCLISLTFLCLDGCYDSPQISKQKIWNEKLDTAAKVTNIFRYDNVPLLSTEQLISLVGQPDYKVKPSEFETLLNPNIDVSIREYTMNEIWRMYLVFKKNPLLKKDKWQNSAEFTDCILWIYDESKHFQKPLPKEFFAGLKPGFNTNIFFFENSNCLGYKHFMNYVPLLDSRRGSYLF